MKTVLILGGLSLALASCASTQNASVADYNGDGVISNAEYSQYNKRADIQDRNVYTESNKRRNTVNSVRDVRDSVGAVRDVRSILRNW